MDTYGYPLRVSLLDKVFANNFKVDINVSNGRDIYKYAPGDLFAKETRISGGGTAKYNAFGPVATDAIIPPQFKPAYDFVINALKAVGNMPEDQRNIARYHMLFIETDDVIWIELGPLWATDELPHLGCQTKLGRDMVFGYDKNAPKERSGGLFLQCF
ncbi:MAG: hypothetical protein DLM50_05905 [Candidatus Meridianibacter frigidus]|nr:MAG: hypothetical protein DLM50_05905 [Candidatus Eremiobacteraeota bacterium]